MSLSLPSFLRNVLKTPVTGSAAPTIQPTAAFQNLFAGYNRDSYVPSAATRQIPYSPMPVPNTVPFSPTPAAPIAPVAPPAPPAPLAPPPPVPVAPPAPPAPAAMPAPTASAAKPSAPATNWFGLPSFLSGLGSTTPTSTVAATSRVDGDAPDPAALRQAVLAYRDAFLADDQANSGYNGMIFSGLTSGSGMRPIFLLPGMMDPHGIRMLSLAWLGREATADEMTQYKAMLTDPNGTSAGPAGAQLVMTAIANKGMIARLARTDRSPEAMVAINKQVSEMLSWQPGDSFIQASTVVPPIPAGPALDPVRSPNVASIGTPVADRANSAQAREALRQAINAYGQAIDELGRKNSDMMVSILGGRFSDRPYLLPGLMLPLGAKMMMLAWLGREPNAAELAKWESWQKGEGGRDVKKAFSDIITDIQNIGLAARLPETDGTPEAITRLKNEMAAKIRWERGDLGQPANK